MIQEYDIPNSGNISYEFERRILDFSLNDTFDEGAIRFNLHYSENISSNLLRRVANRVGTKVEECEPEILENQLKGGARPISGII